MPGAQPQLMRSPLPALIARLLASKGHDARAILTDFGLQGALDGVAILAPIDRLEAFYDHAATCLDEPDLGLVLTERIDRGAYGLPEFSIRAASTLRECLRRLARYSTLINEVTVATLEEDSAEVRIRVVIPGRLRGTGRHANEYYLALLAVGARALGEGPFRIERVWFCHAAPDSKRRHASIFGTENIEFAQPDCGFAITNAVAEIAMRTADAALVRAIDEQAEQLLSQRAQSPDFPDTVQRWLARSLHEGLVTLEDVARGVAMTPRTLQRRLSDHGTNFRELLDAVRRDLFAALDAQGMPQQDIAYRLGYADMGSFRRALRRWGR